MMLALFAGTADGFSFLQLKKSRQHAAARCTSSFIAEVLIIFNAARIVPQLWKGRNLMGKLILNPSGFWSELDNCIDFQLQDIQQRIHSHFVILSGKLHRLTSTGKPAMDLVVMPIIIHKYFFSNEAKRQVHEILRGADLDAGFIYAPRSGWQIKESPMR